MYAYLNGTQGFGFRQTDLSFYGQDNYKVNSRLTLNVGVRYENFLGWPWTEVENRMYNFVPSLSTTQLFKVGTNGIPRSGLSGNNLNFMPRVGFALKVTQKTVVPRRIRNLLFGAERHEFERPFQQRAGYRLLGV